MEQNSYKPSLALRWNRLACDALYYTKTPPTVAARALAMVHTAMYDAWTAYSGGKEVSTTTGAWLKKKDSECTREDREKAFSYAAFYILYKLFHDNLPAEHKKIFEDLMHEISCEVDMETFDVSKPEGIGNLSAKLVLDCRLGDGSNQVNGYADYTSYRPVNSPPPKRPLKDVGKWQPQLDEKKFAQKHLTPHWPLVKPFALSWGGQFRPPSPASCDSDKFNRQLEEIIKISKTLTEEHKIIAEYWAGMQEDKFENHTTIPGYGYWTGPPAQCCRIGHYIAKKNNFKNSNAIKMFFALSNAMLDASIAAWDAKVYYDYTRPVSAIHELYDNKRFQAWGGPCQEIVDMDGEGWCPYLLTTPPFSEYVSGHSTFSNAVAEIITCFCGSNEYGESVSFPPKSSIIEPDCTPSKEITLHWSTLQQAADQAGMSRRYGGIHFEEGDMRGRELGKKVANEVWKKVRLFWNGDLG